ncbi:MAG TPA: hypothetical protein VK658_18850 [Chryseolinea sp.]|nr:hypothetical protein [Chryseolinea sp.]
MTRTHQGYLLEAGALQAHTEVSLPDPENDQQQTYRGGLPVARKKMYKNTLDFNYLTL